MKVVRDSPRPRLFCANGCASDDLDDVAARVTGADWTPPKPVANQTVEAARIAKAEAAVRLWNGSRPTVGTPTELYLNSRGLPCLAHCDTLRHRADCGHPEGGRHAAMIARVQGADGGTIAIHRTYMQRDGRKAALDPPKASLGPMWGGAIRLSPAVDQVVIGEGIESAASAGIILGIPAWAAISAGNLAAGLVLPDQVHAVTIAADNDLNQVGQRAARDAATRWRATGRTVRIIMPDRAGQDFNDVLRERAACLTAA